MRWIIVLILLLMLFMVMINNKIGSQLFQKAGDYFNIEHMVYVSCEGLRLNGIIGNGPDRSLHKSMIFHPFSLGILEKSSDPPEA